MPTTMNGGVDTGPAETTRRPLLHAAGGAPPKLGIWLFIVLAVSFAGYVGFTAFDPQGLAATVVQGGVMNLFFLYGLGLIAGAWLLSLIYVVVANRRTLPLLVLFGVLAAPSAFAADGSATSGVNYTAVALFLALLAGTGWITVRAARHNRSAADFYAAGGNISAWQNGLAIAGDVVSAGAFLGLTGLIFIRGFDGLIYAVGYAIGYPVITLLLADRMRNLGRYTFADVLSFRLKEGPVRLFAAASTLIIVIFYLIAQMVGAGQLIQLLFGLDYAYAEVIVGGVMVCYVLFGGMTATTWVQIVKAVLMMVCGTLISALVLARFGFSYDRLLAAAVAVSPKHAAILVPTSFSASPWSTISLAIAQFCGSAGLPHLIMRFFTVPDARTARNSMLWGSLFTSYFFSLVFIIGFGAVALVGSDPQYLVGGALRGGGNMAAIHLAHAVGGNLMLGFVSAVAFATILAVVAGLTLSGASAISHDLYASVIRKGSVNEAKEVRISKIATLVIGLLAVALGIAFKNQNVAYMIALVVGIAASSNFPLLILAIYWKGLTTRGAISGGLVGLGGSFVLTIAGPSIWVAVLGHAAPLVPLDPPTLITMPLALLTCVGVSLLDRGRQAVADRAAFDRQNDMALGLMQAGSAD